MSRLERIVAACGGILLDGGTRALIPGPDHSSKDRSVSLLESDGRIIIHCFSPKDDWRDVRRALSEKGLFKTSENDRRSAGSSPDVIVQPAAEERRARAKRIWGQGRLLCCTPAAAYLRRRAIDVGVAPDALGFHPRMTSVDDTKRRPALLACITNSADEAQGVQATLLSSHGLAKASVATPRRVIGQLLGGAVRLSQAANELVIAEGVETALSAGIALGKPVWAALTAYNLSLFEPPPEITHLIIAPDTDGAGLSAAEKLKARTDPNLRVSVEMPPGGFNDWNAWACANAER